MSDDDWGDGEVNNVTSTFKATTFGSDNDGGSSFRGRGGGGGGRGSRGGGRGGRGGSSGGRDDTDGGTRSNACHKCGEEGHFSRECPSAGSGGGGGSRACHKCGEEGHMSRECPTGGSGGGGPRTCHKCGEEGHMSRECPTGGGGGSRACHKCNEEGHMARDCPTAGDGGGGGSRACFKCKEEGHMARDCPNAEPEQLDENGEKIEKPPIYVPPAELEGDEAFTDRNQYFEGSGINFNKYDEIKFEISGDSKVPSVTKFEEMNLRPLVMENLVKVGYSTPTPIQRHASPQLFAGNDVMACAQTGSGKTAAFLLPMINTLMANSNELDTDTRPVRPECVILAPTRELAIQISQQSRLYSSQSVLRTVVVYGGTAVFSQRNQLQSGCNILVGTPGRMLQFINDGIISLDKVQFFVLDEADRMLDMGFMGDVKTIVDKMPPVEDRISGMFSATFPVGVQKAAAVFLKPNYIFVVIGVVGGACTDVVQEFVQVERSEKRTKLLEIIKDVSKETKVLVFVNAKKAADFVAASIAGNGVTSTSIHGDRLQSQRELALREFVQGTRQVLVATAVAARGLDIPKVSIVVNYDLPSDIDEYVHRIGRTGRLGHTGRAVSFYEESQDNALASSLVGILKGAGQPVPDFLEGSSDGGFGGVATNGFSSTDHRDRGPSHGVPKVVEQNEEEDWD